MKTLHYRRHSIKDGTVKDTIGLKGLKLARHEGGLLHDAGFPIHRLFHGPLVRTAQTALAFCQGLCGILPDVMPVVLEIGTDELFREMATEQFRVAVKAGMSNFYALQAAHPEDKIVQWMDHSQKGVQSMFDQMEDGETAIAFGHSPVIELAALAYDAGEQPVEKIVTGWDNLSDLEGLIFEGAFLEGQKGLIAVTRKISVAKDAKA